MRSLTSSMYEMYLNNTSTEVMKFQSLKEHYLKEKTVVISSLH